MFIPLSKNLKCKTTKYYTIVRSLARVNSTDMYISTGEGEEKKEERKNKERNFQTVCTDDKSTSRSENVPDEIVLEDMHLYMDPRKLKLT